MCVAMDQVKPKLLKSCLLCYRFALSLQNISTNRDIDYKKSPYRHDTGGGYCAAA